MLIRGLLGLLPALAGSTLAIAVTLSPASADKKSLCVHGIEAPATLPMRAGSSPDSPVIGELAPKTCGLVLAGRCIGKLCQMTLGSRKGWIDTAFVGVYEVPEDAEPARASVIRPVAPPPADTAAAAPPAAVPQPAAQPPPSKGPRPATLRPAPQRASYRAAERRQPAVRRDQETTCVVDVESWDSLRIRSGPGVDHREVGRIPPRACGIVQTGGCSGPWCRVAWRGQYGWVNTRYLDD